MGQPVKYTADQCAEIVNIIGRDHGQLMFVRGCRRCRSAAHSILGIYVKRDGTESVRAYCELCTAFGPRPEWITADLPNPTALKRIFVCAHMKDNSRDAEPCARCGSTNGTQLHHWAPQSIFDDADKWPTSYLCISCHEEWHTRTGVADNYYRKAAA